MIKICVENNEVNFEPVTPGLIQAMQQEDEKHSKQLEDDQSKARANTEKRNNNQRVLAGERINAKGYVKDPDDHHVGIHLSFDLPDQVMWFSDQPINFWVDIARDPELIYLFNEPDPDKDIEIGKNEGLDNPFGVQFPLTSRQGAPVLSGALVKSPEASKQQYYKYTVRVEGIVKPLDPHIAGHFGP
ncbi:MAG TPA: hypothetical protein VE422_36795 [Terriglobia bacterium]|nr:hypothetical protein [Terriglobia bacterium]